eukprot:m.121359 g.121359  ORF g.121359 m.121359 type:complete len:50 (-) comp28847_c0_seq1:124-273(-)
MIIHMFQKDKTLLFKLFNSDITYCTQRHIQPLSEASHLFSPTHNDHDEI